MPVKEKVTDVRDLILEKLDVLERNLNWLSRKTDIPYHSLRSCILKKYYYLTDENLTKINSALGTSFKNTTPKNNK